MAATATGVLLGLVGIAAGLYRLHVLRSVRPVRPERGDFDDDLEFKSAQMRAFYRSMTPWYTLVALGLGVPIFVVSLAAALK